MEREISFLKSETCRETYIVTFYVVFFFFFFCWFFLEILFTSFLWKGRETKKIKKINTTISFKKNLKKKSKDFSIESKSNKHIYLKTGFKNTSCKYKSPKTLFLIKPGPISHHVENKQQQTWPEKKFGR